jgi:hypothetical protein
MIGSAKELAEIESEILAPGRFDVLILFSLRTNRNVQKCFFSI